MGNVTLLAGDVIEVLKTLPDKSVHACICSPPFYGLRDYGTAAKEQRHNRRDTRRNNHE